MQRVTPNTGDAFRLVEKLLWVSFMTALFQVVGEGIPERGVTRLPVKQAHLALLDPTLKVPENWTASYVVTGLLVAALRGQEEFSTADHTIFLREGIKEVQKRNSRRSKEALAETQAGSHGQVSLCLRRVTKTVVWLMV